MGVTHEMTEVLFSRAPHVLVAENGLQGKGTILSLTRAGSVNGLSLASGIPRDGARMTYLLLPQP